MMSILPVLDMATKDGKILRSTKIHRWLKSLEEKYFRKETLSSIVTFR